MRKLLLTVSFFLLCLIFVFSLTSQPIFADSRCYYNGSDMGYMSSEGWHGAHILVNGFYPTIWFTPNSGNIFGNEVFGKVGTFSPSWIQSDLKVGNSYRIWPNMTIPSDLNCGQVWVNVKWQSSRDGGTHYCNELVPRYTQVSQLFINSGCLANNGVCSYNVNPSINKYYYVYLGHIGFDASKYQPSDPAAFCRDTKIWVDDSSQNFNYNAAYSNPKDRCNLGVTSTSYTKKINDGQTAIRVRIESPLPIAQEDFNSGTDWETVYLANYINSSTCGGQIIEAKPTPTPTSTCNVLSQTAGTLKYTFNNTWQFFVPFVLNITGKVTKVAIKAGNWGNAQRSVTCRITNNSGTPISAERSSASFTASSGALWREIDYKSAPVSLQKGLTYRLYCKGPDSWGSLYWIYNQQGNPNSKTYRITLCAN